MEQVGAGMRSRRICDADLFGGFPGGGDATTAISNANAWANMQGTPGVLILSGTYAVNNNLS